MEERAFGDLLGSVLYDGISEFMKKADQLSNLLPGVQAAKKVAGGLGGLLGSLGGGLAGSIAGGMREEVEKRIEQQVRSFSLRCDEVERVVNRTGANRAGAAACRGGGISPRFRKHETHRSANSLEDRRGDLPGHTRFEGQSRQHSP